MTSTYTSEFEVKPFSDLDYDSMTVEIRYQGAPIAEPTKDYGMDACQPIIPSRFSPVDATFTLPLDASLEALNAAKKLIAELG